MRLLLVRHGQTVGNGGGEDRPLSGSFDVPLTAAGHADAARAAQTLAGRCAAADAALYSSPLRRAVDTAAPIARLLGRAAETCADFAEIHCGAVEGLPLAEVRRLYPDHWARNLAQDDPRFRWPEGESCAEFRSRCVRAADALAARHPGGTAVVVTHAGVISQLIGAIGGDSPACWSLHRPGNGSVTELAWGRDRGVVAFDL